MKRLISSLLIIFVFTVCLSVSGNAQSLGELEKKLQEIFDTQRDSSIFPGATVAFILPDGRTINLATGFADKEKNIKMKPKDRMLSGSIGKTYVAVVALQLIQEGKLKLEDKVMDYFKEEEWFKRIPNYSELTIDMIMHHNGGIPRYVMKDEFVKALNENPYKVWKPEELLAYVFDDKPLHAPGEGWAYSDTDYIVLGMIIEKICKNTYYNELKKRVLGPFGLKNTSPSDKPVLEGLIQGSTVGILSFPEKTLEDGKFTVNPQFEWTGGGLITNSYDLALWAKKLYGGEVLPEKYLTMMLQPVGFRTGKPDKIGYGLGVFMIPSQYGMIHGHGGFFPGYLSEMGYFKDLGVAFAIQFNGHSAFGGMTWNEKPKHPIQYISEFMPAIKEFLEGSE